MRALLLLAALLAFPTQQQSTSLIPVIYAPPVDGPVTDPFRAPASPYGPGNRGLEYAVEAGGLVRSAAAGVVTFAGQVGGTLHVTVQHADGARTTYSGLATVDVHAGQEVEAGQPVGTSGNRLFWSVRIGGAYLDPAVLLAASGQVRPHLVPVNEEWRLEASRHGP